MVSQRVVAAESPAKKLVVAALTLKVELVVATEQQATLDLWMFAWLNFDLTILVFVWPYHNC